VDVNDGKKKIRRGVPTVCYILLTGGERKGTGKHIERQLKAGSQGGTDKKVLSTCERRVVGGRRSKVRKTFPPEKEEKMFSRRRMQLHSGGNPQHFFAWYMDHN